MQTYLNVLKQYAVFTGRARRQEYWTFVGMNVAVSLVLGLIDALLGGYGLLTAVYAVGVLLPSLGVLIRRFHDTGKSGWWLLFGLIPLAGPIVMLVFLCTDSEPKVNMYGPNPKAAPPMPMSAPQPPYWPGAGY